MQDWNFYIIFAVGNKTNNNYNTIMKKNTFKFWFKNRFTILGVFCVTILVILGVISDPYLNVFMSIIMLFLVLGVWANLIEDRNANASERLMWKKYSDFIDKLNKFDEE